MLRRVIVALVGGEESESFHELVALADRYVAVVEAFGGLAVDVEPPVALKDRLVEEGRFRAQETLHYQAVVRESADVEYLGKHLARIMAFA